MSKTLPEHLYHGYWRGKRGALIGALCLGGLSHLSIEVGQVLIASRMSDVNDVLSGLLGTALGAALFAMVCKTRAAGSQEGLENRPICLSLMAVYLVLMGFSALKPLAFSFDPEFLAERLSSFNRAPLLGSSPVNILKIRRLTAEAQRRGEEYRPKLSASLRFIFQNQSING